MRAPRTIMMWATAALCALAAACGSSSNSAYDARTGGTPDAAPGTVDAPTTPDASCFTNPHTHYEIINACTNAQSADKTPDLPLTLPDGGLPSLP